MLKTFNLRADFWNEAAEFVQRPIQVSACYFLFLYFSSLFGTMGVELAGVAQEDADLREMALQIFFALDRGLTPMVTVALVLWTLIRNIRERPEFSIPRSIWFAVQCAGLCALSMYYLFFGDGIINWIINLSDSRRDLRLEAIAMSGIVVMLFLIGTLSFFICSIRKLRKKD